MAETEKKSKKEEEAKPPRRRVKKSRGHGGHHGGAWKVAYADFVTAMMALFLVLWLVSQADTKLKESIASYFRSPGVFNTQKGGILPGAKKVSKAPELITSQDDEQSLINIGQNLQKKFETRPEFTKYKDQIKIDVTEEGLRIQVLDKAERVSFAVGNAQLNDEAKAILAEISQAICTLPNSIKIGGHTDSRVFPSDNGYTNWELSADRANAARRELQNGCVKPEQILQIIGYADTDPIDPNDRYAPANRRISITVMRVRDGATQNPSNPATNEADSKDDKKVEKKVSAPEKVQPKETPAEKPSETPKATLLPANDAAKTKLAQDGKVTIGEPDKVPDAPKTRERKPQ